MEVEGVGGELPLHTTQITPRELQSIISRDDYIRLQENIENGKINDVNMLFTNETDKSLLMKACETGSIECVKVLLANKADVNYENNSNCTILSSSCTSGKLEIVNLILSHSALDINTVYTSLVFWIENSSLIPFSIDMGKILLSRIPDINRILKDGKTLLNRASFDGNITAVRLFLESGADRNSIDSNGVDPLYCSSYLGHLEVAKILLEWDSPNHISRENITKAFGVTCYHRHLEMVKYLIDQGVDVNALDDGKLVIDSAIRHNDVVLAELLIANMLDLGAI